MAEVREEVVTLQKLLPTLPSAIIVDLLSIGVREAMFQVQTFEFNGE